MKIVILTWDRLNNIIISFQPYQSSVPPMWFSHLTDEGEKETQRSQFVLDRTIDAKGWSRD